MDDFSSDLNENRTTIFQARSDLIGVVRSLRDEDLAVARRGGWSVKDVLRHVIDAEVAYAKVIGFLTSKQVEAAPASDEDVASPSAVIGALERVRECLLASLDGIDEATFYDLRALGKEQYSVVSVLENVAAHDHEHLEQIAKTVR